MQLICSAGLWKIQKRAMDIYECIDLQHILLQCIAQPHFLGSRLGNRFGNREGNRKP